MISVNDTAPSTDAMCIDILPAKCYAQTSIVLAQTKTTLACDATLLTTDTPEVLTVPRKLCYHIYFISTTDNVRPYFMKLPQMFCEASFMDGLCDVVRPPTLFTFCSLCVVRVVFTPKSRNATCAVTDFGIKHYLNEADKWFTMIELWRAWLPETLLPNVEMFFCASELSLVDTTIYQQQAWNGCPVSASSTLEHLKKFHQTIVYVWNRAPTCLVDTNLPFNDALMSTTRDLFRDLSRDTPTIPFLILLYRDVCPTSQFDVCSRLQSLVRHHVEFQMQPRQHNPSRTSVGSQAFTGSEGPVADVTTVNTSSQAVLASPKINAATVDMITSTNDDETTSRSGSACGDGVLTTTVVAQIKIKLGDSIVYLDPDTCDFVMQQVTGFYGNQPFWLMLKDQPENASKLDGDTVVALFNELTGELMSTLQPLHQFLCTPITTKVA